MSAAAVLKSTVIVFWPTVKLALQFSFAKLALFGELLMALKVANFFLQITKLAQRLWPLPLQTPTAHAVGAPTQALLC